MLLDPAVNKAMEVLQDPEVRAKLLEQGRSLADAAQRWRETRQAKPAGGGYEDDPSPMSRLIGNRFGQQRLERRVENLREALEKLGDGRPDLAAPLLPVARAVENVSTALSVAGTLPFYKRKRAHIRIDGELDQLETGLFDAAFDAPT